MEHKLKIRVSREREGDGVASVRVVSMREKMLRFLLGDRQRLTIIVPGESVRELAISDMQEGGEP